MTDDVTKGLELADDYCKCSMLSKSAYEASREALRAHLQYMADKAAGAGAGAGVPVAWMHTDGHIQRRDQNWPAETAKLYTPDKGWTPLYADAPAAPTQVSGVPDGYVLLPRKPTPAIREALRTGSRKDYPSDELCDVRYAALVALAAPTTPVRVADVPEGWKFTDRQLSVLRFALLQFATSARHQADAAVQDKSGKVWVQPMAAHESFMNDALDAEELRDLLAAPAAPQPATTEESSAPEPAQPRDAVVAMLKSALLRVTTNFHLAVTGKPVRDMAETLAEVDSAVAEAEKAAQPTELRSCSACGHMDTHPVISTSPAELERQMGEGLVDRVSKALTRAWSLGQTYWQQADSDSYSQNKKSGATQAKFNQLVDETRAAVLAACPHEGRAEG